MSYSQQLHKGSFVYLTGTLWKEFKTHTFSMWIYIIISKKGPHFGTPRLARPYIRLLIDANSSL